MDEDERVEGETVDLDGIEAEALFADELEPETIPLPGPWGERGCFVTLLPMDGSGLSRLWGRAQDLVTGEGGNLRAGSIHMDRFERDLVAGTVVDFVLARKGKEKGTETVVWSELRRDAKKGSVAEVRDWTADVLCGNPGKGVRGLAPGAWRWLVGHCYRLNGMSDKAKGN